MFRGRISSLLFILIAAIAGAQNKTYLALGDSVARGYQPNSTSRGPGDKGYVRLFADYLGTIQGGVRPRLINLGIPGESTASFYDTSEVGGLLNSNYPILFRQSQANTLHAKVVSEHAAGRTITHVTFTLGTNDLLDLETSSFFAMPFEQQMAAVDSTLAAATVNMNYALIFVRQDCPTAVLKIPGYYNPYGALPGTQEDRLGQYAIPKLNRIIQLLAKRFHAAFAPNYKPFVRNGLTLTWIGQNDVHPTYAGYAIIAQAVILAQYLYSRPLVDRALLPSLVPARRDWGGVMVKGQMTFF